MKPMSQFFQFSSPKKSQSKVISGKRLAIKKKKKKMRICYLSDSWRGLWCDSEGYGLRCFMARVKLSSLLPAVRLWTSSPSLQDSFLHLKNRFDNSTNLIGPLGGLHEFLRGTENGTWHVASAPFSCCHLRDP